MGRCCTATRVKVRENLLGRGLRTPQKIINNIVPVWRHKDLVFCSLKHEEVTGQIHGRKSVKHP